MKKTLSLEVHISYDQEGTYFYIPFDVPANIESLALKYDYPRRPPGEQEIDLGVFTGRTEVNIIDLGLISPVGAQVGASGSDKTKIFVSQTCATAGYQPCPILPGRWQILVGAYKIEPQGVTVHYEIELVSKERRLLKGDLHTHTLASDGVHTMEELAWKARRNGLDFVAVTDHNQFSTRAALPYMEGVTMIPGVEWTHFKGHASFLGIDQPYDQSFAANTPEEVLARFTSARDRGALIVIDHPFDENCGFQFNLSQLPFDCLEIWNGPMRESNLKALGYWQQLLTAGRKIPLCGGSDYHRDTPFIFLGGPTMGVYAKSNADSDILDAVRLGHGFITFAPNGPVVDLSAGDAEMGDTVQWSDEKELLIRAEGLLAGDVLRVVTGTVSEVLFKAPVDGDVKLTYPMTAPGFARVEILRAFLPSLPMLPALLTNPIYFVEG